MWTLINYKGEEVEEFYDSDDMKMYAREHLFTFDQINLESYINDNYSASTIYDYLADALYKDKKDAERFYYEVLGDAEREAWDDSADGEPVEGQDWKFDGNRFVWSEEPEEEDE